MLISLVHSDLFKIYIRISTFDALAALLTAFPQPIEVQNKLQTFWMIFRVRPENACVRNACRTECRDLIWFGIIGWDADFVTAHNFGIMPPASSDNVHSLNTLQRFKIIPSSRCSLDRLRTLHFDAPFPLHVANKVTRKNRETTYAVRWKRVLSAVVLPATATNEERSSAHARTYDDRFRFVHIIFGCYALCEFLKVHQRIVKWTTEENRTNL